MNNIMKKIILTSMICVFSFIIATPFGYARTPTKQSPPGTGAGVSDNGIKSETCNTEDGPVCIDNPLGKGIDTPQKLIGNIIKALLGVIGSIALVMFVYGGFMWMTAAGEKAKVTKGADTMLWAVLGLTVIFSSYALVRFVIEKVGS